MRPIGSPAAIVDVSAVKYPPSHWETYALLPSGEREMECEYRPIPAGIYGSRLASVSVTGIRPEL